MDAPREIAARLQDWAAGTPRGPFTLELYPTLRCNLACAFCDTTYRHRPAQDELSRERYLRLADEAAALEVRRCYVLGGGEPMVARQVTPALLERLKHHGIEGILGTNGTLFSPETLRMLVDIGWDEVHVSLDGATAQVNDTLRGQPGAFDRATQALAQLTALKQAAGSSLPRLVLHTVLTTLNYRQLPELVGLAARLGCYRVNFDALIAYRPEQERLRLTTAERLVLPRFAALGLAEAARVGVETTLEQFLIARTLDRGSLTFAPRGGEGLAGAACLNPWHHLVIHHDGRVSPCCVIPSEGEADSVRDRTLEEVWFRGVTFQGLREGFLKGIQTRHCCNCSMALIGHNDVIRGHLTAGS